MLLLVELRNDDGRPSSVVVHSDVVFDLVYATDGRVDVVLVVVLVDTDVFAIDGKVVFDTFELVVSDVVFDAVAFGTFLLVVFFVSFLGGGQSSASDEEHVSQVHSLSSPESSALAAVAVVAAAVSLTLVRLGGDGVFCFLGFSFI